MCFSYNFANVLKPVVVWASGLAARCHRPGMCRVQDVREEGAVVCVEASGLEVRDPKLQGPT